MFGTCSTPDTQERLFEDVVPSLKPIGREGYVLLYFVSNNITSICWVPL